MATRDELRAALQHPNVKAFLRVIREGESSQTDDAYRMLYGGGYFSSFDEHPRQAIKSPWGWTSAAGAYQILAAVPGKVKTDTWDRVAEKYEFTDFSPATQDEAAVALIAERGALQDLLRGDLSEVLDKVSFEWASLPPGRYGQPTLDAKQVYSTYEKWLREFTTAPPAASAPPVATTLPSEEKTMPLPLVWAAAAAEVLLPFVADLFRGHGGQTATRNADLIEKVGVPLVEIAKGVAGASTEQQAAQAIAGDPALQEQFRQAVAVDLDRLVGMMARMTQMEDDSRDRAAARAAKDTQDFAPTLIKHQFWMLGAMSTATVIAMMVAVILKVPNEVTVGLVVLFTGLVNSTATKWATMIEYRFGSSASSHNKDDAIIAAGLRK